MFNSLTVFEMAHAMALHAGHRQALVAENIANANTPGYQVRDLTSFFEAYKTQHLSSNFRSTRPGHLFDISNGTELTANVMSSSRSANGNSVSLEEQMLAAVDVKRQHDRAVAIYKSSLGILRSSLGRTG